MNKIMSRLFGIFAVIFTMQSTPVEADKERCARVRALGERILLVHQSGRPLTVELDRVKSIITIPEQLANNIAILEMIYEEVPIYENENERVEKIGDMLDYIEKRCLEGETPK